MLGVTLFGIFLTPVFFYVIQWFKDRAPESPQGGAFARPGAGHSTGTRRSTTA